MNKVPFVMVVLLVALTACSDEPVRAVGQLESDRIELIAEVTEPVIEILVNEGNDVIAGQPLLRLDDRRQVALLAEARANLSEMQARLAELVRGPRAEKISAARAALYGARKELEFRKKDLQRFRSLVTRKLTSEENVDEAQMALDTGQAQFDSAKAELAELETGTTEEELQQARQQVERTKALVEKLTIDVDRMTIKSPVNGRVDTVPFELGEQPQVGQIVAVVLDGKQPYARVYVPEPIRVNVNSGDSARVHIDGLASILEGTVRRIENEASFTPYLALTRHDRGRLSYVAEITLPDTEKRLPDGVPVEAEFLP